MEAIKRDPNCAQAYLRLAILRDQEGKFQESKGLFLQALAASPGDPDVYCAYGFSLYLQRQWTEAEKNLLQAVALRPDDVRAHTNLGLVFAHTRDADQALAEFRKAHLSEADAHANLAFALSADRRFDEARSHYALALAIQPTDRTRRELQQVNAIVRASSTAQPQPSSSAHTTAVSHQD
jgi:Tfp pilus assembly protein PilF